MTNRENYLSIARRKGYDYMPVHFDMCPSLQKKYEAYVREHDLQLPLGHGYICDLPADFTSPEEFKKLCYQNKNFKPGTFIDQWGVAHEPGSEAAFHMTYMHNPMAEFDSTEQILSYPMPEFRVEGIEEQIRQAKKLHDADRAVIGNMQCTVWETAWYMRGMENLFCDMMAEDPMAEILLDRVTELAIRRAVSFTKAMCGRFVFRRRHRHAAHHHDE